MSNREEGDEDDEAPRNPVHKFHASAAHISEGLIRRVTGCRELRDVSSLNLRLCAERGPIKVIDNLDGLVHLKELSLSHNAIGRIERLAHLTALTDLNLAENQIGRIEGLDTLVNLERLNLHGNKIERIPKSIARLHRLAVLRLSNNQLTVLRDIENLKSLANLTTLSLHGNPCAALSHARLFAVFQIRSLDALDDQSVSPQERRRADERFAREEIDLLETALARRDRALHNMKRDFDTEQQKLRDMEVEVAHLQGEVTSSKRYSGRLEAELSAKSQLLEKKTVELTRTCEQLYAMEQEVAFLKIDQAFWGKEGDSLSFATPISSTKTHPRGAPSPHLSHTAPATPRLKTVEDRAEFVRDELNVLHGSFDEATTCVTRLRVRREACRCEIEEGQRCVEEATCHSGAGELLVASLEHMRYPVEAKKAEFGERTRLIEVVKKQLDDSQARGASQTELKALQERKETCMARLVFLDTKDAGAEEDEEDGSQGGAGEDENALDDASRKEAQHAISDLLALEREARERVQKSYGAMREIEAELVAAEGEEARLLADIEAKERELRVIDRDRDSEECETELRARLAERDRRIEELEAALLEHQKTLGELPAREIIKGLEQRVADLHEENQRLSEELERQCTVQEQKADVPLEGVLTTLGSVLGSEGRSELETRTERDETEQAKARVLELEKEIAHIRDQAHLEEQVLRDAITRLKVSLCIPDSYTSIVDELGLVERTVLRTKGEAATITAAMQDEEKRLAFVREELVRAEGVLQEQEEASRAAEEEIATMRRQVQEEETKAHDVTNKLRCEEREIEQALEQKRREMEDVKAELQEQRLSLERGQEMARSFHEDLNKVMQEMREAGIKEEKRVREQIRAEESRLDVVSKHMQQAEARTAEAEQKLAETHKLFAELHNEAILLRDSIIHVRKAIVAAVGCSSPTMVEDNEASVKTLVEVLETEARSLAKNVEDARHAAEEEQKRLHVLEAQVYSAEKEREEEQNKELEAVQQQLHETQKRLEGTVRVVEDENDGLRAAHAELRRQLGERDEALADWEQNTHGLEEELEEAKSVIEELSGRVRILENAMEEQEQEAEVERRETAQREWDISQTIQQVQEEMEDRAQSLRKQLTLHEKEEVTLRARLEEERAETERFQREAGQLMDEKTSLARDGDGLRKKIKELEAHLREEKRAVLQQGRELMEEKKRLRVVQEERMEHKEDTSQLEEAMALLRSREQDVCEELTRRDRHIEALSDQLAESRRSLKELRAFVKQLQGQSRKRDEQFKAALGASARPAVVCSSGEQAVDLAEKMMVVEEDQRRRRRERSPFRVVQASLSAPPSVQDRVSASWHSNQMDDTESTTTTTDRGAVWRGRVRAHVHRLLQEAAVLKERQTSVPSYSREHAQISAERERIESSLDVLKRNKNI